MPMSKRWIVFIFRLIGAFRFMLRPSVVVGSTWRWRLLTYIIMFKQLKLSEIIFLFVFFGQSYFSHRRITRSDPNLFYLNYSHFWRWESKVTFNWHSLMNGKLIYDNIMRSVKIRNMAKGFNGYHSLLGHLRLAEGI